MLDFDRTKTKVIEFLVDIDKLCKERRLSLADEEKLKLAIEMLKVHKLGILLATFERIKKELPIRIEAFKRRKNENLLSVIG